MIFHEGDLVNVHPEALRRICSRRMIPPPARIVMIYPDRKEVDLSLYLGGPSHEVCMQIVNPSAILSHAGHLPPEFLVPIARSTI